MEVNETKISKPWFKKKRYLFPIVFLILGFVGQSGKSDSLIATNYKNAGFFDSDSGKYYWGAYFNLDSLSPWTKVTCTLRGLDGEGNELIKETYTGNVTNTHMVVKYGEKRLSETTKNIQESIKSFDATCKEK
jgi:hypothetical protein